MGKRIKPLKENNKRIKWEIITLIVMIILGIPAYILLVKPQKVVIINPSIKAIESQPGNTKNQATENITKQTGDAKSQAIPEPEVFVAMADKDFSPISLDQFYETYYDDSLTDLQQQDFVNKQMNKRMVWEGEIETIEEDMDGIITALICSKKREFHNAFCKFNSEYKEDLLKLKPKQYITVTGILRNVVASPFLRDCKLLKISE